ncbi:uncharacterized protein K441DRAFT_263234 [Cenococcum geophilum 1.58]|uniref:uncharacterized protein n=1 Tax=Cenococcum geophilum 1.58 TaxID=794803 RepID=UPI00359019C0|nr:hypothetical protein K441DRAFT_263234 [Cenococcum geophilum 1.58]
MERHLTHLPLQHSSLHPCDRIRKIHLHMLGTAVCIETTLATHQHAQTYLSTTSLSTGRSYRTFTTPLPKPFPIFSPISTPISTSAFPILVSPPHPLSLPSQTRVRPPSIPDSAALASPV